MRSELTDIINRLHNAYEAQFDDPDLLIEERDERMCNFDDILEEIYFLFSEMEGLIADSEGFKDEYLKELEIKRKQYEVLEAAINKVGDGRVDSAQIVEFLDSALIEAEEIDMVSLPGNDTP